MLLAWCVACACECYPLVAGVPEGTFVPSAVALGQPGVLPENVCVFVIEQFEEPEIASLEDLLRWGNAEEVCGRFGKVVAYPCVERATLDFVRAVEDAYERVMFLDSAHECLCRMRNYEGGLVVVKVLDNEPGVVSRVIESLPSGSAVAFVPAE